MGIKRTISPKILLGGRLITRLKVLFLNQSDLSNVHAGLTAFLIHAGIFDLYMQGLSTFLIANLWLIVDKNC